MKITPEYLLTLPDWMAAILTENSVKDIYDPDRDWKKFPGDFEYRIFSHDFPVLIQATGDSLSMFFKDETDGRVHELHNCYLTRLVTLDDDSPEFKIPVNYKFDSLDKKEMCDKND